VRPRELPDLWTAHYKGNGFRAQNNPGSPEMGITE
jgi:hypothetical protein